MSIEKETEQLMKKSVDHLIEEYKSLRTNRVNPSMLDNLTVSAYGSDVGLKTVASVSVQERNLIVTPFDRGISGEVAKSINASSLNLNAIDEGGTIRVPVPPLNEDLRKEIAPNEITHRPLNGRHALLVEPSVIIPCDPSEILGLSVTYVQIAADHIIAMVPINIHPVKIVIRETLFNFSRKHPMDFDVRMPRKTRHDLPVPDIQIGLPLSVSPSEYASRVIRLKRPRINQVKLLWSGNLQDCVREFPT